MKLWSITLLFYDQHGLLWHRMKLFHLLVSLLLLGTRDLCNSCCVIKMIKQEKKLCCCPSYYAPSSCPQTRLQDLCCCCFVAFITSSLCTSNFGAYMLCTSSSVINYTLFKLCTCQKAQPTSSCTVVLHKMSVCLTLPNRCPKCTEIMIILTEYNCQVNERGWEMKRWNTSENQSTHYLLVTETLFVLCTIPTYHLFFACAYSGRLSTSLRK